MKTLIQLAVLGATGATLTACPIIDALIENTHVLQVVNRCRSPNDTVDFSLDGVFQASVRFSQSFTLLTGTHALRAVGTGAGGSVFEDTEYIDSDVVWTLCP